MLRTRSNSRWTVHPWAQLSQSTLPLYVLRIPLCHTIHFHHVHRMVPNNNIWNQICLRLCEEIQIPQRETDSEHWIDRNFLADFSGVFISQGASNKFPSCGEEIKLFFFTDRPIVNAPLGQWIIVMTKARKTTLPYAVIRFVSLR